MERLELLIIENWKYFAIFSFVSCGIIEALKRLIRRFVEVIFVGLPDIQKYFLLLLRAFNSILPLPFGIYIGSLLFKISLSDVQEEKQIYIFFMLGATYIMYFFLFKTIIERLKSLASKWKKIN